MVENPRHRFWQFSETKQLTPSAICSNHRQTSKLKLSRKLCQRLWLVKISRNGHRPEYPAADTPKAFYTMALTNSESKSLASFSS